MDRTLRWTIVLTGVLLATELLHSRSSVALGEGPLVIVEAGAGEAVIALPDEASRTERFAAKELQRYIEQISGPRLEIKAERRAGEVMRVLIGRTRASELARRRLEERNPDAFIVQAALHELVLVGGSDRGTLYAVYDFLENELGCHWLGPGEHWEHVPQRETIRLSGINRLEEPAIAYRMTRESGGDAYDPDTVRGQGLYWSLKHKHNIGRTANGTSASPVDFRAWVRPHTVGRMMPPEDYLEDHPDWYAVDDDGEPITTRRLHYQHLCTTHPEVIDEMAVRLGGMLDENPTWDVIALNPGDGMHRGACQCNEQTKPNAHKAAGAPSCTSLDTGGIWHPNVPNYTRRWLTFVNAVARQLQQTHPDKKIVTLAYSATNPPSDPEVITPESNVMIQIALWSGVGCRRHTLTNPDCPLHEVFRDHWDRWGRITPAGSGIYSYIPRGSMHTMPYPAPRRFIENIRYLHDNGIKLYEGQIQSRVWSTYGITKYAVSKAMWDPGVDADEVMRDYCDHAFGDASDPMRHFYMTLEDALVNAEDCSHGHIWGVYTPDVIEKAKTHIEQAKALTDDELILKRIEAMENGLSYGEMYDRAREMALDAIENEDPERLAEAIALGEELYAFVDERIGDAIDERQWFGNVYRFRRVYLSRWRDTLEQMLTD